MLCDVMFAADFGFARFLQDGVMAATLCGSPMYMVCFILCLFCRSSRAKHLLKVATLLLS